MGYGPVSHLHRQPSGQPCLKPRRGRTDAIHKRMRSHGSDGPQRLIGQATRWCTHCRFHPVQSPVFAGGNVSLVFTNWQAASRLHGHITDSWYSRPHNWLLVLFKDSRRGVLLKRAGRLTAVVKRRVPTNRYSTDPLSLHFQRRRRITGTVAQLELCCGLQRPASLEDGVLWAVPPAFPWRIISNCPLARFSSLVNVPLLCTEPEGLQPTVLARAGQVWSRTSRFHRGCQAPHAAREALSRGRFQIKRAEKNAAHTVSAQLHSNNIKSTRQPTLMVGR